MEIRDVEICRHRAVDDHGNQYTIIMKQKTKFAKGTFQDAPMQMVYVLENGQDVERIDEGVFRLVESGIVLRKSG